MTHSNPPGIVENRHLLGENVRQVRWALKLFLPLAAMVVLMLLPTPFPPVVSSDSTVSFGPATNFPVGSPGPFAIAIADLNADERPDLITANINANTVSILLGTGTGSFEDAINFPVGASPTSIAIGDLNADGNPDLVTTNQSSADVSILHGNGDGTFPCTPTFGLCISDGAAFVAHPSFPAGTTPFGIAVADLNGDGTLDVVVGNGYFASSVSVILGAGDGSLGPATSFTALSLIYRVAIGDLNGDGNLDIVTVSFNAVYQGLSVLLGVGDGTFGPPAYIGVGLSFAVAIGDLNGDGKLDLAVPVQMPGLLTEGHVTVLPGLGNGTFDLGASQTFLVGITPYGIAIGDLNGDGGLDLATANLSSDDVSVLLNGASVDPTPPKPPSTPDLANEDDTGVSEIDNLTQNTSGLTLSGTAEAESTVELFDGAASLGTTPAAGTGNWSKDLTLSAGMHSITAKATDAEGNISSASGTLSVVVDGTPPDTSITSRVDGNGAAVASGGSTVSGSIAFTFDGTDNVEVAGFKCSLDGTAYAPCVSPVGYSALAVGSHTFQVLATDVAGNEDTSPATFTWGVITPAEASQNLIAAIGNMGLPASVAKSLTAPLGKISALLSDNDPGNDGDVCSKLDSFINQVNSSAKKKQLTTAQAQQLLQAATAIKSSLGCP
ncbi:MAG: hypothetical protein EXR46_06080 [Dehalococcoidia bacterium]|nr:hypothetical protein [Dehalococcoidia bacterium]